MSSNTYRATLFITVLLLLGAVFRVYILYLLRETPYAAFPLPDEKYYHDWAVAILHGNHSTGFFEYAPLPAYLMACVYRIAGENIDYIRYLNIPVNLAGCLLIYGIAEKIVGRWWALVALALALFSAELALYSVVPLKTSLAFFLFALYSYSVVLLFHQNSVRFSLLAGVSLGLAFNVRPNVLILFLFTLPVIYYCMEKREKVVKTFSMGMTFCLGLGTAASLFLIHGFFDDREVSFLPAQSGFLFFATNTISNPTPYYLPVPFASSHPAEQGVQFQIEASLSEDRRMTMPEASAYWREQVARQAILEPGRAARKWGLKFLSLFSLSENSDHYSLRLLQSISPFFSLLQLKLWGLLLLGYSGIVLSFNHSKACRGLSLVAVLYLSTLFLYSVGTRFLLPLTAILVPMATWVIKQLFESCHRMEMARLVHICLVILLLVFLGNVDYPGRGDRSKHLNTLAYIKKEQGDWDEAVAIWKESAALEQSYSDIASLFLAGDDYRTRGADAAMTRLHNIPDSSFMVAAKYASMADIQKQRGQISSAVELYEKSLTYNRGQLRVRDEILGILHAKDRRKWREEKKKRQLIRSYYSSR